jgi:hypothetical protein
MTLSEGLRLRLQFLARVVRKECGHLAHTDQRLFELPFSVERARQLDSNPETAERVEAFVGRFGRLQDTLGDKLLPLLLVALGETTAAMIDNLDNAERLGLINSADDWLAMRKLCSQMVHEYVEDPEILANALQSGHGFVATLVAAANRMLGEIEARGWE